MMDLFTLIADELAAFTIEELFALRAGDTPNSESMPTPEVESEAEFTGE